MPLSPYLYILMVESLSRKLEVERIIGNLPSLQIARGTKDINHSQFFDNTLLLGATSTIIARRFKQVLDTFLLASGGKINCSKRKMYGWNVSGNLRDVISRIFGFPFITTWKHFKYLGMPIFLNSSLSQAWQDILDKIATRIQSWGG
jgi:hypothetical protein